MRLFRKKRTAKRIRKAIKLRNLIRDNPPVPLECRDPDFRYSIRMFQGKRTRKIWVLFTSSLSEEAIIRIINKN